MVEFRIPFIFEGNFGRRIVSYFAFFACMLERALLNAFSMRIEMVGKKQFFSSVVRHIAVPITFGSFWAKARFVIKPHHTSIINIYRQQTFSKSRKLATFDINLSPMNIFLYLYQSLQPPTYNFMMRKTVAFLRNNRFLFSTKTNYFRLFDLPYSFTDQQLKSSYLELVKKYHPDLSKDPEAPNIFREVQIGYEILSDPKKRRQHQLEQEAPGQSAQQSVVDEVVDRFYKNFERKDQLNDEFNFSYKMFKQHYQKVEAPKADYQRYEGQGGDEYYAHKKEQGEKTWKQVAAAASAVAVIGLAYAYTHW